MNRHRARGKAAVLAMALTATLLSPAGVGSASAQSSCTNVPVLDGDWCTSSAQARHINQGVLPLIVQALSVCHVGGDPNDIDGIYGKNSGALVKAAQLHLREEHGHRLVVDGQAGFRTGKALVADRTYLGQTLDQDSKLIDSYRLNGTECIIEAYSGSDIIVNVAHEDLRRVRGVATAEDVRCLLYTSPSPRDATLSRMPSSA